MSVLLEEDKALWIPDWLDGPPDPPAAKSFAPADKSIHVNLVPGEIEVADDELLADEIRRHGRIAEEPEIGRARDLRLIPSLDRPASIELPPLPSAQVDVELRVGGYSDTYWTHFDYREDVAKEVVRTQKKFPWQTYMNTYYCHPPVYGRKYEFVSWDVWQGGIIGGKYVGYRGKPLNLELGRRVFNAVFYDPFAPPIYWIIYRGRMWTRGYGWGPSPGGPPDSDPQHNLHIHKSSLLVY